MPGAGTHSEPFSEEEIKAMYHSGEINDETMLTTTEDVMVPPGADLNAYLKLYSERSVVLKHAYMRFSGMFRAPGESTLEFERYYQDLHKDILEHRDFWFEEMFRIHDEPTLENSGNAERATGILGTLCTILRQRGDLDGCMEVMETYMQVLKLYQQMTDLNCEQNPGDTKMKFCCDVLTYKANLIRINCGVQLNDADMAVKALRDAVAYEKELKSKGKFDEDAYADYDMMMSVFFESDDFDNVKDGDLFKALKFTVNPAPAEQLRSCARCEKEEECFGDYKKCSRCSDPEASYCSKACQAKDWPVHKLLCGAKNTTNVEASNLLEIAKILVSNHGKTAENRTGRPIPECQKEKAKIGLIKHLKQLLTSEFQHFNNNKYLADAGRDPAFLQALADFFADQPGYSEVWSVLRVGMKERLEENRVRIQQKGGDEALMVDEEELRNRCFALAQALIVQFGKAMPGGQADMLDSSLMEKIVDDLTAVTKKFILEFPEYNSHRGVQEMINNPIYKERLLGAIQSSMGLEMGPGALKDQA